MKTIYEFKNSENPVVDACNYAFGEIEKVLDGRTDHDGLIQDIHDKILELKGIMMSECYVPKRIADLLFKLGFNRGCSCTYDENSDLVFPNDSVYNSNLPEGHVTAPTLQEASRWLHEHCDLYFDITTSRDRSGKVLYKIAIKDAKLPSEFPVLKTYENLESQEEATILGLLWSLEFECLVKQKTGDDEG